MIWKVGLFKKWLIVTMEHYVVVVWILIEVTNKIVDPLLSCIKHFRGFIWLLLQDRHKLVSEFNLLVINELI